MRPSEALAKHRDEILAVLARFPVSNPPIFGSVARGEDVEGSDLDILVGPKPGCSYTDLFRIEDSLAAILGDIWVDVHTDAEFGQRSAARVMRDVSPL